MQNSSQLLKTFKTGLDELALTLEESQIVKLLDFLALIDKWNKTHNLTALKSPQEMLSKHLLDSLSVVEMLGSLINKKPSASQVLDVGTGAGLPGIPLSVFFTQTQFTLLDSSYKRVAFLFEAKRALSLSNIEPVHCRVEKYLKDKNSDQKPVLFDFILSRAYSSLAQMLEQTDHLLSNTGYWLALKGLYPEQEIKDIAARYDVESVQSIDVPMLDAQRHLLIIRKKPD